MLHPMQGLRSALPKHYMYTKLTLAKAWRVENRTLWGKFAAERQQTANTVANLTDPNIRLKRRTRTCGKGCWKHHGRCKSMGAVTARSTSATFSTGWATLGGEGEWRRCRATWGR